MALDTQGVDLMAALMRTRFDQFGKQMLRALLAMHGPVETDAEVVTDPRRVDLWFTPDPTRTPVRNGLGLLGQITANPSSLEFFHCTPSGDDLTTCMIKHGQFRHALSLRRPAPPLPIQWVISSGRPGDGIAGLRFYAMHGWPPGIYTGPPLLWTRLVVVSELPVVRETLLLRLLGAGPVLKQAIAELKALGAAELERSLVLPILVRLRLELLSDPKRQTDDDQEFLMDTQDIVETWRQEAVQEGRQEVLLHLLRQRFGHEVDAHVERRVATASREQLDTWTGRVLSAATLSELLGD
jgi:hypothetical protein